MQPEKESIVRKLNMAQASLSALDEELSRLEGLLAPLNQQLAKIQNDRKYFQSRVEKLTRRLADI